MVLTELKLTKITGNFFILSLPFLTEFGQYFHIVPGTFDRLDLIFYLLTILLFTIIYPSSIIGTDMKKIQAFLIPSTVFAFFLVIALASATSKPRYAYQKPKPQPCITHKALTYSPVLVTFYVSGSYNMKDLSEAQRTVPAVLLSKLNALSPGKYQMADGVRPNLSLYVDYRTDSYGHYGADIKGYVFDGDFHYWTESNFITFDKLDEEVAYRVNWLITGGWCKNCPSPCTP
jgi:hypothetical protein